MGVGPGIAVCILIRSDSNNHVVHRRGAPAAIKAVKRSARWRFIDCVEPEVPKHRGVALPRTAPGLENGQNRLRAADIKIAGLFDRQVGDPHVVRDKRKTLAANAEASRRKIEFKAERSRK